MGKLDITVYIVNHTHWDREWYFTTADSLVLSDQIFSDILEELNRNTNVSFVLDGQISILDEYIQIHPGKINLIKKLINQNQLFVGPWYTQTDSFFTSGESILRNGMIGIFESKKYGKYMPIGYLPDTFGFNAQMPLILNHLGLDNIIFWRGINFNKQIKSPYFIWKSLGGKEEVFAVNLPQGYGTGMLLEATEDFVQGRLDPAVDFIFKYSQESDILIPSGNDQLNIIKDFKKKIEKINEIGKYKYKSSDYVEFLELIKNKKLEEYQGEFREPTLARVHKTIGSVRMDIKMGAYVLEQKLVKRIEPLVVIAKRLGIEVSVHLLMKAWKKLLECQAHDSLAGCVSDSVAEDILHRLKEADEICDSIENIIEKQLAVSLKLSETEILLFNTSFHEFKGYKTVKLLSKSKNIKVEGAESVVLDYEYIESRENILEETSSGNKYITEESYYILTVLIKCTLPSLGYKIFSFNESNSSEVLGKSYEIQEISNSHGKIYFENDGICFKNDNKTILNFLTFIDEGNTGDTYDFSPCIEAQPIELYFSKCEIRKSNLIQTMTLKGVTMLPLDLSDRVSGENLTACPFLLEISLKKDDPTIYCHFRFENNILNHRLRLQLNCNEKVHFVKSSLPFGFISRKNKTINNWEKEYKEKPVNIEPFESVVSAITDKTSVTLFGNGVKEYEYAKNNLFITLFSTTGSLGKPDLVYRPGRASGDTTKKGHVMIATPKAQLLHEELVYDFSLRIDNKELSEDELTMWRYQQEQPSVYYQLQDLNYFIYRIDNKIQSRLQCISNLKKQFSLLGISDGYYVSSCSPSYYDKDAMIIRIENPTSRNKNIDVHQLFKRYQAQVVNALEEEVSCPANIPPYSVLSIKIREY